MTSSAFMRVFLAAAASALMLTGLSFGSAQAYPDAKVDTQIRPSFGFLVKPAINQCCRTYDHRRRGSWCQRHPYSCPDGGIPSSTDCDPTYGCQPPVDGGQGYGNAEQVDCRQDPYALQNALGRVSRGGAIYVRGGLCRGGLYISGDVVIYGQGKPVFEEGPDPGVATIGVTGQQCIKVSDGVRAEFHNMVFDARGAGRYSCIESDGGSVALINSMIKYEGDGSPVHVDYGRLILRDTTIKSASYDPAISADGSETEISGALIYSEGVGIDMTPAEHHPSVIRNSGFFGTGSPDDPAAAGIVVHSAREVLPQLQIEYVTVKGFRTGIWVGRRADVKIIGARVSRSSIGVLSEGSVYLEGSAIGASDLGVYLMSGMGDIRGNVLYGYGRSPIFSERHPKLPASNNWIFGSSCDGYPADVFECRLMTQLPDSLRNDIGGESGPYGWRDTSYMSIPFPCERRGWRHRGGCRGPRGSGFDHGLKLELGIGLKAY